MEGPYSLTSAQLKRMGAMLKFTLTHIRNREIDDVMAFVQSVLEQVCFCLLAPLSIGLSFLNQVQVLTGLAAVRGAERGQRDHGDCARALQMARIHVWPCKRPRPVSPRLCRPAQVRRLLLLLLVLMLLIFFVDFLYCGCYCGCFNDYRFVVVVGGGCSGVFFLP
jgi:hypothetical protein